MVPTPHIIQFKMNALFHKIRVDIIPKSKFMLNGYIRRNTKHKIEGRIYWTLGWVIKQQVENDAN